MIWLSWPFNCNFTTKNNFCFYRRIVWVKTRRFDFYDCATSLGYEFANIWSCVINILPFERKLRASRPKKVVETTFITGPWLQFFENPFLGIMGIFFKMEGIYDHISTESAYYVIFIYRIFNFLLIKNLDVYERLVCVSNLNQKNLRKNFLID